jgi:thiol:disulfide interchange protein DsbD
MARRVAIRLLASLVVVLGGWVSLRLVPSADLTKSVARAHTPEWDVYTADKLRAAARQDRWAVVKFTADWCPNCLLVENTALRDHRVIRAFQQHRALLLEADLTRENREAKELLAKMGSRSIPFLAVFPPGKGFWEPFFLRDLYGVDDVLEAFSQSGTD